MQDSWQQLKSDSISWRKTLKNSHNSQIQRLVVSAHCQEMKKYLNQKVGFGWTLRLDPYWKLQPVAYKVKNGVEIRIESLKKDHSHSWVRISHGLELAWTTKSGTTTSRKSQKCMKNMRWNWMRVVLHADQRPKQDHKDENLPILSQKRYLLDKDLGPMLSQENIQSPIMQCRRN